MAAHENQVFRANVFRNALQKLSGNDDIRVALVSNSRALNAHTMSNSATVVGDVEGRQCIIVSYISILLRFRELILSHNVFVNAIGRRLTISSTLGEQ